MRMPAVIESPLFAPAELAAIRLDGDCFPVGDALVSVDQPVDAAVRARSIAADARQHELVAELWTAAWIHGVVPTLPRPHQLSIDVRRAERTRMRPGTREVLFDDGEVLQLGGLAVTGPFRTACDLARLERSDSPELRRVLAALLALAGCEGAEAVDRFRGAPPTPYKRRGVARFEAVAAGAPLAP